MGSTCGVGQYLWSTTFPVAIVDSYCLGTDYITAHEFGHNLGARHNQEKVWATEQHVGPKKLKTIFQQYDDDEIDYNRGYMIPDTNKRTIMS